MARNRHIGYIMRARQAQSETDTWSKRSKANKKYSCKTTAGGWKSINFAHQMFDYQNDV